MTARTWTVLDDFCRALVPQLHRSVIITIIIIIIIIIIITNSKQWVRPWLVDTEHNVVQRCSSQQSSTEQLYWTRHDDCRPNSPTYRHTQTHTHTPSHVSTVTEINIIDQPCSLLYGQERRNDGAWRTFNGYTELQAIVSTVLLTAHHTDSFSCHLSARTEFAGYGVCRLTVRDD